MNIVVLYRARRLFCVTITSFISEKQQPAYCDRHGKRNDQIDDRRKLIADSCNEGGVKEVKELPQGKKQYLEYTKCHILVLYHQITFSDICFFLSLEKLRIINQSPVYYLTL